MTLGCAATLYCPDGLVTRLQMAAFISRLSPLLGPEIVDENDAPVGHLQWLPIPAQNFPPLQPLAFAAINVAGTLYRVELRWTDSQFSTTGATHHHSILYELPNCEGKLYLPYQLPATVPQFAFLSHDLRGQIRAYVPVAQNTLNAARSRLRLEPVAGSYCSPAGQTAVTEVTDVGPVDLPRSTNGYFVLRIR